MTKKKDSDWLESFAQIDRTILFDSTWMMSSQWLHVSVQPLPVAWSYGDVTCKYFLFYFIIIDCNSQLNHIYIHI